MDLKNQDKIKKKKESWLSWSSWLTIKIGQDNYMICWCERGSIWLHMNAT